MKSALPLGKIDPKILARLLSRYTSTGNRVLVGAGIGEDAAIIQTGPAHLVAKTDPITHVTGEIGRYAVHINANDIASMGGRPLWFLATLLMPSQSDARQIKRIFSQISRSCKELGIVYCGGHTEVTSSVNIPIVVGHMLGEVTDKHLKPTSSARAGDDLVMTKSAGIEATAIIALEKEKELEESFSRRFIRKAQRYLRAPGISVVKDAALVRGIPGVHAFHDPTEGGLATGIYEMARASDLGVEVYGDRIPLTEETRLLCQYCRINPLGAFASGSLLVSVEHSASDKAISRLLKAGIPAVRIGKMVPKKKGMKLVTGQKAVNLPVFHQDELSKLFG
ncbi:MAG: AIR synthase family protein [Deltaproteobacteria bacterium]